LSFKVEGKKRLYLYEIKDREDGVVLTKGTYRADNSWQAKAIALFYDMRDYRLQLEKSGVYARGAPKEKDAEESSFWQELPQSILRTLSVSADPSAEGGWCRYFDDRYLLDDGKYCADTPEPESPPSVRPR
jgi:hypothetical protein